MRLASGWTHCELSAARAISHKPLVSQQAVSASSAQGWNREAAA